MISLLLIPFLTCVGLVMIHVFFGSFVLRRGIIFIDLALAQWAALGYIVGVLFHVHHPNMLYIMAFLFTVIAALILVILKDVYNRINLQEAVIGVMYITATALATGIISSYGMEGSHLHEMLTGHLLIVSISELTTSLIIYSVVGALLFLFRSIWLQKEGGALGNFIFYSLFGAVVTSSVKLVGVLLVFSYLVIPVLSTSLLFKETKWQIGGGWVFGLLGSIIGLSLSLVLDVPLSYLIILSLVGLWIVSIVMSLFLFKKSN